MRLRAVVVALLAAGSLAVRAETGEEQVAARANAAHEKVFLANRFPPATACRTCHPRQFEQWSVSQHAYAQMSPVFNAMHGTVLQLTNGTNGDFCIRCHTPIGMNLGEPLFMSNMDRDPAAREGITCVACHRVSKAYGKISGRLALVEGSLFQPVYGPTGDAELKRVLDNPDEYRVVTDPKQQGRAIHTGVVKFFQLTEPGFCGGCHDVTLVNGFRLEEAFSEYKTSPAAGNGVTCQDCHMGKEPGKASGYDEGPAAVVGGVPTRPRKLSDHRFAGPDHSVIHPALFPFNDRAQQIATMREWLQFDWKAGWGTDAFEDSVAEDYPFPEHWRSVDDRYDAREIVEGNLKRLEEMAELRRQVLRNGYQLGDVRATRNGAGGLEIAVEVKNATEGHNAPTGFTAERLVWLHTLVKDASGRTLFESGDLDPNGDLRDAHSHYVHDGRLPRDAQLFSLQSKFLTANLRGGEREQVLAVNYSIDPLPFLRPDTLPTFLKGRITGARIHKQGIPPLGRRRHRYEVAPGQLGGQPPYTVEVELKAGMIPVNLLAAIQGVGFDYEMSPAAVARNVVAGHQVLWSRTLTVGGAGEPADAATGGGSGGAAEEHDSSRLSEEPIPLAKLPARPRPLLELGEPFLGTGTLGKGFTVPGGATWQPALLVWGNLRSAVHGVQAGGRTQSAAWLNRADVFGQLNLTPTERVLASFRPLDEDGQFAGYRFSPGRAAQDSQFNASLRTLFFEGDFGELLPNLDRSDSHALDYGFAVGRMPVFFQEGMLVNDALDGVGLVRNSLRPSASASNLRVTGLFGWGQVHRGGSNLLDRSARLYGLFTELDVPSSTIDLDAIFLDAGSTTGRGLFGGLSSVQRLGGRFNTTWRVLGSRALDQETPAVGDGLLLYSALSWSPRGSDDLVYVNAYGALGRFTPAARDAGLGGPLTLVGILYEGVGLGAGYGAVLRNQAQDSFGGALGYQKFLRGTRSQLVFELGARKGTQAPDRRGEGAFATRFQQAFGRHLIARLEGFVHVREDDATRVGARSELSLKF